MADVLTVEITGLKELERKMIALGPKISRKALKSALVAGAKVIQEVAQQRAPVKSGRLRRAMYVKRINKPNPYAENVIFGVRHGSKMQKRDLDAYYWSFLEFGTKYIKAMAFVRNAFKIAKLRAVERVKEVLTKKITALARENV